MRALLLLLGTIGFIASERPFGRSTLITRDPALDSGCRHAAKLLKCPGCGGNVIVGRVRDDASGAPMAATVSLLWRGKGSATFMPTVRTNGEGYFVLRNLKGDKWVEVVADGFQAADAIVGPGHICVDVYLASQRAGALGRPKP
jgi:hypothetical protein